MGNLSEYEADRLQMEKYISNVPDTQSVAHFKPSADIIKLPLKFDIEKLRSAVDDLTGNEAFIDLGSGFQATTLTQRPGVSVVTDNDLSGRFYTRIDDTLKEYPRDEIVDESEFSDLVDVYKGTYFEHVHDELSKRYPIGRMRVLLKEVYNCNSWHRDPEPRLHIPIFSKPWIIIYCQSSLYPPARRWVSIFYRHSRLSHCA